MKTTLRILAAILLLFLGFGAIYGSWMLISDPSGGKFGWSLDILTGTPFKSFLFPGIILLIVNGLFPLYVVLMTVLNNRLAPLLILFQGGIVITWLTIQLLMNPDFFLPTTHYPSYIVGVLLVIAGLLLRRISPHS